MAIGTYGTPAGNEAWLEYAVANLGPVSVCIYVSNSFFSYTSGRLTINYFIKNFVKKIQSFFLLIKGVHTETACTQDVWQSMNHCVAIVG